MRSPALGTPTITLPSAAANPYRPLEEYLNEQFAEGSGLEIRCAPREDRLLVLVEHAIAVQPPIQQTFAEVKAKLESIPPAVWSAVWTADPERKTPPESLKASFFIRVLHQKQPYGNAEETVIPLSQETGRGLGLELLEGDSVVAETVLDQGQPLLPAASTLDQLLGDADFSEEVSLDPEVAAAFSPEHLRLEPLPPTRDPDTPAAAPPLEASDAERLDDASGDDAHPDEGDEDYEDEGPIQEPFHIPRSVWAAGLGLCLFTFGSSFYVASRPCWFRSCPPLTVAQEQVEEVNGMLQVASTWDDLEAARQELSEALRQLRAVPGWTSHGEQARSLRTRYRRLLKSLTPLQDALEQADLAQQKSGVGQLKIKQWQEVMVHWEAAIAQLKGVAPDSPMYALAQDKLAQYEANFETASNRLAQEQEAQRLLSEARSLASEAPKTSDDLEMLAFLQRTQIKLQDALFTLRQVPRGTTAYTEAVRLMSRYESELSLNQGQQTREEFIVNSYRDAQGSAESAKIAEANGRWPDARDHWKAAITSLNQVPSASSYYAEAQGMLSEYAYALQEAEKEAQKYAELEKIKAELDEVCDGSPQVCRYDVTPQLIKVTLTLDYERAILTAGSVGDEDSRISALNHVHSLETALEKTSNRAQIPLELYDPDGVLVGMHQPRGSLGAI